MPVHARAARIGLSEWVPNSAILFSSVVDICKEIPCTVTKRYHRTGMSSGGEYPGALNRRAPKCMMTQLWLDIRSSGCNGVKQWWHHVGLIFPQSAPTVMTSKPFIGTVTQYSSQTFLPFQPSLCPCGVPICSVTLLVQPIINCYP